MNEDTTRGWAVVLKSQRTAFYLHVDDGVAAARDRSRPGQAAKLMNKGVDAHERIGFTVSDRWRAIEDNFFKVVS